MLRFSGVFKSDYPATGSEVGVPESVLIPGAAERLGATNTLRAATLARPGRIFAVCLAVVLGLQLWTGSYRVERGIYSDDAAHFMNGLVIRDYLTSALGQDPLRFAEGYYLSYPKIAPLMWPPLFHVALGLFLLPGWPPAVAALFFVALIAAWLAWRLYGMVRTIAGPLAAFLATSLTLTTPLVQALSGVVMLDIAIAAFVLEAVYWLARYAQSSSRRDAVLFGVFAAAACLTKGDGVAVVLAPLVLIGITGRYDLLRKSGLYIAAAIVLVFAVPLLAVSARLDHAIGDFGPVTIPMVVQRLQFYFGQLWRQVGPLSMLLSFVGMAVAIRTGSKEKAPEILPIKEALVALVFATVTFHLLTPHLATVSRYLTVTIGPLIGLAFVGAWAIVDLVRPAARRSASRMLVAGAIVLAAVVTRPGLQHNRPLGYRDIIARLTESGELAGRRLLVVSDEVGEGAFVSEAAVMGVHPSPTMVRGSKLLASDSWLGRDFRMRYASPAALLSDLEALHIAYVLVDASEASRQLPYFAQVQALVETEPVRFALDYSRAADPTNGPRRSLALYRVTSLSDGPPKQIEIDLSSTLGRSLRR